MNDHALSGIRGAVDDIGKLAAGGAAADFAPSAHMYEIYVLYNLYFIILNAVTPINKVAHFVRNPNDWKLLRMGALHRPDLSGCSDSRPALQASFWDGSGS